MRSCHRKPFLSIEKPTTPHPGYAPNAAHEDPSPKLTLLGQVVGSHGWREPVLVTRCSRASRTHTGSTRGPTDGRESETSAIAENVKNSYQNSMTCSFCWI